MRSIVILIALLSVNTLYADDHDTARPPITLWIQQLGDDNFFVRQRAESFLLNAGVQAQTELQQARQHRDVEIARRAEHILNRMEQTFLEAENRDVALWVQWYTEATNQAVQAQIIWALADPTLDLSKGEGLRTLCRLARFDENSTLRLEAAKTLIAFPPVSQTLRRTWYQYILNNFFELHEDEVHRALAGYAKLWCELDDAESGSLDVVELHGRVRQAGEQTLRLLDRPENTIQTGSAVDILLHYAVAELYDAAGLSEERDTVVASALAVQTQPIQNAEMLPVGNVDRGLTMFEHYHVGECLALRFRLHWALAQFRKVIEEGNIVLRVFASEHAARVAAYLDDYPLGIVFYDKHWELLDSPEYRREHDPTRQIAHARKQRAYYQAEQAAAENDWDSVLKYITQAWAVPGMQIDVADIDLVILAHRLCERSSGITKQFRDKTAKMMTQIWKSIDADLNHGPPEMRWERMPYAFNSAAWLLANTGRERPEDSYRAALIFAESALKSEPDNANMLDTLAHVYFLGGKIEEAVRTQERVVRLAPESVLFRKVLERFTADSQ